MQPSTLDILVCPTCHGKLSLESAQVHPSIQEGMLSCTGCRRQYPIHQGIPHFINASRLDGLNRRFAHLYDWFSLIYAGFSRVGFRLLGTTEKRARSELLSRLEPAGGRVLEVSIGPG